MKTFVTGGACFIGSAVVRHAVRAGHGVVNLDALTHAACLDNVPALADSPLYVFEHADIRDRAALDRIFAAGTCKPLEAARAYRVAQGIWTTRHGGARCITERALGKGWGWLAKTMASLTSKQTTFA